ncbi:MAG: Mov34/MPN/PAD-1 family protein [Candidatus Diapherotrites archaeon]
MIFRIKKDVLEGIIEAVKNTYPREFFALLGSSNDKIIDEIIVVPAIYGSTHVLIKSNLIPFDSKIVGSVHSHPIGLPKPSTEDLRHFSNFGDVHLIISWPFSIDSIKAYDVHGKEIELVIVE